MGSWLAHIENKEIKAALRRILGLVLWTSIDIQIGHTVVIFIKCTFNNKGIYFLHIHFMQNSCSKIHINSTFFSSLPLNVDNIYMYMDINTSTALGLYGREFRVIIRSVLLFFGGLSDVCFFRSEYKTTYHIQVYIFVQQNKPTDDTKIKREEIIKQNKSTAYSLCAVSDGVWNARTVNVI